MKKIYNSIKRKILMLSVASLTSAGAFAQTDVLVCGATGDPAWLTDVQNKLIATGSFNSVQTYNIYLTGTPTLAYLQTFDAVLVYTDYGAMDPVAMGNNLAAYIDGGGGVVTSVFANASVPIDGAFNDTTYQVIIPDGGQTDSPTLYFGAVLNGCSSIIDGITSFNGGSSSYRTTATTLVSGGYFTVNWDNGEWLIAQRENVGPMNARRADLNFYPPSSDARSDFWDASTQGGEIMANALLWVAGVTNNAPAPAMPAAISGLTTVCETSTNLYSISAVSGATDYTWTVDGGMVIQSGQGTTDIAVLASIPSGTITVTANDGACKSDPQTVSVIIGVLPTVGYTSTVTDTICEGSNITLSGTGASVYTWTGGITDATPFPAVAGTYIVTGIDSIGCSNNDTATISTYALPVVTADASDDSVCVSATTVTLNGLPSGGTWSGSTAISGSTFNPSAAGTGNYTLVYSFTDGNGCTANESIPVNVDACLGVSENNLLTGLTVYPNPSNGNFNITTNGAELTSLEIIALDGSRVYSAALNKVSATAVDASMLANGIYMVRLTGNGVEHTVRISVQK